ncbi:MAG TPA: PQQ-binding-like beta-propeller repeat protein [Verrucomicrobiae bacterium]|nr:PQQ-binding-like beta-propeller repeat protein [Verrucomicrobiae bacterium]
MATGVPRLGHVRLSWLRQLDGAVYAEPLVVGGLVIVATENDTVYALNSVDGGVAWRRHLGTPVPLSALPCGDINPLGITGTPAYDRATGLVYLVAELTGSRHVLFALDARSGRIAWSRRVDVAFSSPVATQQRTALAIGNGMVYFGFGGHSGDCANYRGAVVGVPVDGRGPTLTYAVPTPRQGAVWAPGGPVLDAHGRLYVATGNGSAFHPPYDGSDSVLELSSRLRLISRFAPATWARDNAEDLDLGSVSPTLLPDGYVFIAGKSGTGYVLRQSALGGIGHPVASAPVCASFGSTAFVGDTVYVPCTDGIRAVAVEPSGGLRILWHTPAGANGPPVVGGGAVWSVDTSSGVLYALSPRTGAVRASVNLGLVPHFVSPTLVGGRVFVGTSLGVVAVIGA